MLNTSGGYPLVSREERLLSQGWANFYFLVFVGLTVTLNNYEWLIGGNTFTPERLLAAPLFVILLVILLFKGASIPLPVTSILVFLWLALALISSIFSKVPAWSLKMYAGLLLAASFYYVTLWLKPNLLAVFRSAGFLAAAWFLGPLVSIVYCLSLSGYPLPDFALHWLQEGSGGTRVRATIHEANLFAVFLVFVNLAVIALNFKRRLWWWVLLFGLHAALVFSFSRVPWVSYLVALMVYYVLVSPRKYTVRRLAGSFLVVALALIFMAFISYFIYVEYGEHEIIGRIHSLRTRLVMWELALESVADRPTLGNGIYSFSELYSYAPALVGSETHRSAWISNLPLAILHDTGIVGFIVFFTFVAMVVSKSWRAVRYTACNEYFDRYYVRIGAVLVAFSFSLVVSGQSIPAHSLGFFWVGLALADWYSSMERSCRHFIEYGRV